ncbi:MAG TPA: hypothetical protein VK489_15420 [Ferruginibacter sp.]|nr:hypothetical protein [Ferruginibacter sp.]
MRYLFIICIFFLFSCSDSFINHDLEFEKLGDCSGLETPVKVTSNINGQRYEFRRCLDDDFDGKDYSVERSGDSILVNFPKTTAKKHAEYNLILDIDAKPKYHHILIDGQELAVTLAQK